MSRVRTLCAFLAVALVFAGCSMRPAALRASQVARPAGVPPAHVVAPDPVQGPSAAAVAAPAPTAGSTRSDPAPARGSAPAGPPPPAPAPTTAAPGCTHAVFYARIGRPIAGCAAAAAPSRECAIVTALPASSFCTSPAPQVMPPTSLATQSVRRDTTGKQVDAHDGEIVLANGVYYWYGTSYGEKGSGCYFELLSSTSQFCGFKVYTSSSLDGPWQDRGTLFDPAPWQSRCAAPNFGCFRPRVLFNAADNQWVLWANVSDRATQPGDPGVQAWTSPSPTGPFVIVPRPIVHAHLGPQLVGDIDLFEDAGGRGYVAYAVIGPNNEHDIAVERLDSHYLNGTGDFTLLGLPMAEAPALFSQGGVYYLTYSDPACPYCSGTGTGLATAGHPLGPWTRRGDISADSCGGQPDAVSLIPGLGYLYQSDLWLGTWNESKANQHWELLTVGPAASIANLTCDEWPYHRG